MSPRKYFPVFPQYSIKQSIEGFCFKLYKSKKFDTITDEDMAALYNLGERSKNYTYRRRACVEYGLITRKSTNNSLSLVGLRIIRSNSKTVEILKILSFIHSIKIKFLLRHFIVNNDNLVYDDGEFYDFLLEKGVTETNIKKIIKGFNESLEYLDIITPERKLDLNDEYIKVIKSDDEDKFNSIIAKILRPTNQKDGIYDKTTEIIKEPKNKDMPNLIEDYPKVDSLTDIPFITMSGKTFLLSKDSSGGLEYYIVSKDLTDKEKKRLDDYVISIQKK